MNDTAHGVEVSLSPSEMMAAALAGVMRQVENCARSRTPRFGAGTASDWQLHIEGCLGEYVIAKFLGVFWPGKGKLRAADVGEVDVRTRSRDHYELILHESDPDDRVFWLVCGANGKYRVKGWITGQDGKKPLYWKDPAGGRPAYFVPQSALHSPQDFWEYHGL